MKIKYFVKHFNSPKTPVDERTFYNRYSNQRDELGRLKFKLEHDFDESKDVITNTLVAVEYNDDKEYNLFNYE